LEVIKRRILFMNKDKKFQELALDGKGRTPKGHLKHFKKSFQEVYGDMKISPEDVEESNGFALIPGKIKALDLFLLFYSLKGKD
jgi:hypothetical protein